MRRSTFLILGLGLAGTLLTSSMALAGGGNYWRGAKGHAVSRYGGHGHGGMTSHLLRHLLKNKQELGLTDEQVTKLRTVALDADRARIRAEADVMVSERELRSMIWDEKAQLPAIEAKVKEKESFDAAVRIIGIKAGRDLIAVLTPEQQAKQKALWHHYRQQRGHHMMKAETDDVTNEPAEMEAGLNSSEAELS